MSSSPPRHSAAGFTLFEVLAAVLVLGLLYSVLAQSAIVGLRSEGRDRRIAEASLLADGELAGIEALFAVGSFLEFGVSETDVDFYHVVLDVQPVDVLTLLPAALLGEIEAENAALPTLLVDDRGDSRVQQVTIRVEWDEAGETASVERTTYAFDTSSLPELVATAAEQAGEDADEGEEELDEETQRMVEQLGGDVPPELIDLIRQRNPGGQ